MFNAHVSVDRLDYGRDSSDAWELQKTQILSLANRVEEPIQQRRGKEVKKLNSAFKDRRL